MYSNVEYHVTVQAFQARVLKFFKVDVFEIKELEYKNFHHDNIRKIN